MCNLCGLGLVLLLAACVAGCVTVNPKPVEIETPTAARHFIVATFAIVGA
jgi:hypothetical protein